MKSRTRFKQWDHFGFLGEGCVLGQPSLTRKYSVKTPRISQISRMGNYAADFRRTPVRSLTGDRPTGRETRPGGSAIRVLRVIGG